MDIYRRMHGISKEDLDRQTDETLRRIASRREQREEAGVIKPSFESSREASLLRSVGGLKSKQRQAGADREEGDNHQG